MGNAKMGDRLPDTLTPLSISQEQKEISLPWGRLYSFLEKFKSVDLTQEVISLGRAESCTIMVCLENFPANTMLNISKLHFTITRDIYNNLVYLKDESKNGTFINGGLVGKGNTNILQHNDLISVGLRGNQKLFMFKMLDEDESNKYLPDILRKKYKLSRFLGKGACGEVHLLFEKTTTRAYAVKKIKKGSSNNLNDPLNISNEIKILQVLSHPCIIQMREIVETETDVFIILEYMGGGELTSRILSIQGMTEHNVKFIFYQIGIGVQYLHSKGITHRDLKPDNVLLATDAKETIVKISDFGLSKILDNYSMMETICGTPTYVAPEVIDGKYSEYSKKVDVWSLGVILYYMLAKELPFRSADRLTLNKLIINGQWTFKSPKWLNVSALAKDLIKKMLVLDPVKRFSIHDVLEHPWIAEDANELQYKLSNILNDQNYSGEYIIDSSVTSDTCEDTSDPPSKKSRLE